MESGPKAAPENSRLSPLPGRPGRGPIALSKAEAWPSPIPVQRGGQDDGGPLRLPHFRSCCLHHEAGDVLRGELDPDVGPEGVDGEMAEILVEVSELRRQHDRLDTD